MATKRAWGAPVPVDVGNTPDDRGEPIRLPNGELASPEPSKKLPATGVPEDRGEDPSNSLSQ